MRAVRTLEAMPQPCQHRDLTAAPTYELYLHWHPRFHHEPANCWIRDGMSELVKGPMQHAPLPNTKRMRTTGAQ